MKAELFDFHLPPELIAQEPANKRSESRLLVYHKKSATVEHRKFTNIVEYFQPGDLLVVNSSRVIPARIFTNKNSDGRGGYEVLFVKTLSGNGRFEAMVRPGKRFRQGHRHMLPGNLEIEVETVLDTGLRVLKTVNAEDPLPTFREYGIMPLPPYITAKQHEPGRYQTVYSDVEGSIAAPTAGLHFDDNIFAQLKTKGVNIAQIILHVGLGTFKPIESENIIDHKMHEEVFYISEETAQLFAQTRQAGKRVWACGTTSVRTLESAIQPDGRLNTGWQSTDCFIWPGYKFKAVDLFLTNFHLPRSTLIVLVAAFCSREAVLSLYEQAVNKQYRFYSFGDAMLLL